MTTLSPDGSPLDTLLLRTFVAVVDHGSFVAAADRLALTPSAISGHIRRLEHMTQASLLLRTTRRLELTQAGDTLYSYGRNILELEREARARLRGTPLSGRLRLGASEDFASAWLPQVLQRFQREHPAATLELKVGITADLLRQQERGRLDLVFGKRCQRIEEDGELLWEEPLAWAFAKDRSLSLEETLPLALFPESCVYREAAVEALGRSGHSWRVVFESSSMAGCLAAAQAGFALTVITYRQCEEGLRLLGQDEGLPELPRARFYAFVAKPNPAAARLIEAARHAGSLNAATAARPA